MKNKKLFIAFALLVVLFSSCKKDLHYDVSNVSGVNAEGEVLLPIGSKTFSMMDMMQRFQIDSLITCADDGSLAYGYHYENYGVLSGDELLRFKDLEQMEHYSIPNPYIGVSMPFIDTVIRFHQAVTFEANHLSVLEATMKLGRLDFAISSNVAAFQKVVIRTHNIKDASGHDFEQMFYPQNNTFGFNLADFRYVTDEPNSLDLDFELHCTISPISDPELFVDVKIMGTDLAFREMKGFVESYNTRSLTDTTFKLFPENISGLMEVNGIKLRLSERNSFGLDARLLVDTAWVWGEGLAPYSIFDPMPLVVDLPIQPSFGTVHDQTLNGMVTTSGGRVLIASEFTVNPSGGDELVVVADTCKLDVRVDVSLPFSFNVSEVQYLDTVGLNLSGLEMPDMIERLTIGMTFNSTLPLNLNGQFYLYNSENEMIMDTLVSEGKLIQASFDGHTTVSTISIDITEDRIERALSSDCIIMRYELDTEARDVELNANQKLGLSVQAKVK